MQPYSDYEIAQRRIQERQRKKNQFRASLLITILVLFLTFLGRDVGYCTIPLAVIVGLFAVANWIELYYTAPTRSLNATEVEQEMEWLFGDTWQEQANTQAYVLAQDRIRERRISKWRFYGHFLLYLPINGLVILSSMNGQKPEGVIVLLLAIWFFIFIYHARSTFPTKQMLKERENDFGETMRHGLASLQSSDLSKSKEKLKRGKYYEVGDDGELVEVEDEIMRLEDKPKREMDNR